MDFICIGAPRSGTTWLYHRLNELPDIELLPVKEIHYFDRDKRYVSPSNLSEAKLFKRLQNGGWLKKVIRDLIRCLINLDFKKFRWYCNYYFERYNDSWYLSLFDSSKIAGDITPAYSILEEEDIKRIKNLLPEVKIIYLLRNPIDRSWSSYKKGYIRDKNMALSNAEIVDFFKSHGTSSRSSYLQNMERYLQYFDPGQILIGFYDAIKYQPSVLLKDVVEFIGADPKNIGSHCNLNKVENFSPGKQMPEEVNLFLKTNYSGDIAMLSDKIGSYASTWIEETALDENTHYPATFLLSKTKILS